MYVARADDEVRTAYPQFLTRLIGKMVRNVADVAGCSAADRAWAITHWLSARCCFRAQSMTRRSPIASSPYAVELPRKCEVGVCPVSNKSRHSPSPDFDAVETRISRTEK